MTSPERVRASSGAGSGSFDFEAKNFSILRYKCLFFCGAVRLNFGKIKLDLGRCGRRRRKRSQRIQLIT